MKTTGLSGKSGTGKSYNAIELSAKLKTDAIIDDGLFIAGGSIAAGKSAKREKTRIGAVKTAIFTDDDHCRQVKLAIARHKPEHILILGTSDDMIRKIAERLELPLPEEIVQIEDITTEKQRQTARNMRSEAGMHTIPAPTFQVKKQFSGYFIDARRSFDSESDKAKTVVRPTYSYLGSYEISDKVINQIVDYGVRQIPGCAQLLFSASINSEEGLYIRAIILAERGFKIRQSAEKLQEYVSKAVSSMTSFNILGVEVEIRGYK